MPVKLQPPIIREFTLADIDAKYDNDGSPTLITVRQATRGNMDARADRANLMTQVFDSVSPTQSWFRDFTTIRSLNKYEVYLTLAKCNILDFDGTPLFKFKEERNRSSLDMTEAQFSVAWATLEDDIADAIIACVHEVNIGWSKPGESN